jgi:DNA polymerase-3 subunit gamma/tau
VLEAVKNVRKVTWILLRNASVHSMTDGILTLRFNREGDVKGFVGSQCDADLQRVLADSFGLKVQVRAMVGAAPAPGDIGSAGTKSENSSLTVASDLPPLPPEPPEASPEPPPSAAPPPAAPPSSPPRPASPQVRTGHGVDEGDPFDASDPDASAGEADLTGMDLIRRELDGEIIDEIDNS